MNKYRKEMVEWLNPTEFNIFLTLNFNMSSRTHMRTGYNKVKEFHARVDRGVLGKYWHLKPYEERTENGGVIMYQ